MKLSEIKTGLIDQFFTDGSQGVPLDQLDTVFESIGNAIGVDLSSERLTLLQHQQSNQSNDPSKAFKRFTEGRISMLTIVEEDGMNAIFAAVRSGMSVKIVDLTITPLVERESGLLAVKNAIKQAKNRNDEVFFNITITDERD
jgi:hypothetical protein